MSWTETWQSWLDYRKEIKKPYKSPKSMETALKWLWKFPEDVRISIIETSIRNGWQGLFEPKNYNLNNGATISEGREQKATGSGRGRQSGTSDFFAESTAEFARRNAGSGES